MKLRHVIGAIIFITVVCFALWGCNDNENHHRQFNNDDLAVATPTEVPQEPTPTEGPKEYKKIIKVELAGGSSTSCDNCTLTETDKELILTASDGVWVYEKVNILYYSQTQEEK